MTFAGAQAGTLDPQLVRYLLAHQGSARFLVATTTSSYASLFILDTNQPAMALGGYQGWDRILTPAQLARLVAQGVVRYFYLPASANGSVGGPGTGSAAVATGSTDQTGDLTQWVRTTCTVVPSSTWQTAAVSDTTTTTQGTRSRGFMGGGMELYACAG
jgi:hypothetical protein